MLYYLQGRKMNLALAYIFNIVIGSINLLGLLIWFNIGTVALKNWFGLSIPELEGHDSLQQALSLGRLDLVTILLAIIGVALVLGGIFAFLNFREIAKTQAENKANEVAKKTADEYLEEHLNDVVAHQLAAMNIPNEMANNFAKAQENEENET